ncbi:Aspartate aminotransferase [Nesidiocoris tenuis]|uniref:Aspartate aminotransferase n=1 Tax=Nesidiocoris tenuis TaxID=355587 RepID=A0ABN7AZM7_9HEMI|nr:Aspartate aminotransferase [Nesidiocoris tenuis]
MSRYAHVEKAPPIEVFELNKACIADPAPKKANLCIGVYRTEEGQPWVLPCVKEAELSMAQNDALNHEYLPVLGLEPFSNAAVSLLLGDVETSPPLAEGRAFGVQTLSGTGALRVVAEFLARILKYTTFYVSLPTWENHRLVFFNAGFKTCMEYRYWDEQKRGLDFDGMIEDLKAAPPNSVIILHACAHNPTGCDPTKEQWKIIADIVQEKQLFPLFDSAYQGFATGDAENDAWAVRYFANERNIELICCQSFAKNFGLYNERVGNATFVVSDPKVMVEMKSQLTLIVRGMYSNPPNHGARIVCTILNDSALRENWKECIKSMSKRIIDMRLGLRERLERLKTPGDWSHITTQIGMFSYTGLNRDQVDYLISKHHVYLLKSGRINMCGLNPSNLDFVAGAFDDAVRNVK